MSYLSDGVLGHLRDVADRPDLSGTRYELEGRLGRGGMGSVYRVRDAELGREVALKVLSAPDPTGELAERLVREARNLARLEHPGIVPVHDVGRLPDGRVFYVMKLVRGKRLDAWRAEEPSRAEALRLFRKLCDAVGFAHAHGVVHRDLKPENVMVGPFGEALVLDWGVAKNLRARRDGTEDAVDPEGETVVMSADASARPGAGGERADRRGQSAAETEHGVILGTPAYWAPEQARGEVGRTDQRADVYALGAILRFLLEGRPAAATAIADGSGRGAGDAGRARGAGGGSIPRPLEAIVARAMAPEAGDRYPTALELGAEVDRFLDGSPVAAYRESLAERTGRWVARHRTLVLVVAAYLVMRVAALYFVRR